MIKPFRIVRRAIAFYPVPIRSVRSRVPRSSGNIPSHVYQTWKSNKVPFALSLEVRHFRKLNSDYSFSHFDDNQMDSYMSTFYANQPILDVFTRVRMPVLKADIWRYCILFREGGIYCDIKSAMGIPLRTLVKEDLSELISFEGLKWRDLMFPGQYADPAVFLPGPPESIKADLEHPDNTILNWFLCFEKKNPILNEVINLIVRHAPFYKDRVFANASMAGNHFTGVIAYTQAVWMWMQKSGKRPAQCGINYSGHGIWKLRGMDYRESPHHSSIKNVTLLD